MNKNKPWSLIKRKNLILKIKLSVLLLALIVLSIPTLTTEAKNIGLPEAADKKVLSVTDKITIATLKSHIDLKTALGISYCESRNNPKAKNWQGSSATGLFQFTMATWWNNCEGDVKDIDDNIACFMKLYPKHPAWWACDPIVKNELAKQ